MAEQSVAELDETCDAPRASQVAERAGGMSGCINLAERYEPVEVRYVDLGGLWVHDGAMVHAAGDFYYIFLTSLEPLGAEVEQVAEHAYAIRLNGRRFIVGAPVIPVRFASTAPVGRGSGRPTLTRQVLQRVLNVSRWLSPAIFSV